jgi:uncharacterized protein YaaQ
MKLLVAVIQGKDSEGLLERLGNRGYQATRVDSAGGFLKECNATIFVGVQEEYLPDVIAIVSETCHARTRFVNPLIPVVEPAEFYVADPVEVEVGGATVFVLDIERYERIA